jgi:hypothetical protein
MFRCALIRLPTDRGSSDYTSQTKKPLGSPSGFFVRTRQYAVDVVFCVQAGDVFAADLTHHFRDMEGVETPSAVNQRQTLTAADIGISPRGYSQFREIGRVAVGSQSIAAWSYESSSGAITSQEKQDGVKHRRRFTF